MARLALLGALLLLGTGSLAQGAPKPAAPGKPARLGAPIASLPLAPANQGPTVGEVLKSLGATRYLELVEASNATEAIGSQPAKSTTVIAASNKAIDAWLAANNMTMADVAAREALADRIVGYSIVYDNARDVIAEIQPNGTKVFLETYNPGWAMTARREKGGTLALADAEGATVAVKDRRRDGSSDLIHVVDRLLLPGNVFQRFLDFTFDVVLDNGTVATRDPFRTLKALVTRAGLERLRGTDFTAFGPTDEAFAAIGLTPASAQRFTPDEAKALLQYHMVPGYHPIPNLAPNKPVPTKLLIGGKPAALQLAYRTQEGPNGEKIGIASVKDGTGGVATVVAPNWFSGKVTLHFIDRVLVPDAATAALLKRAAAATPGAAAATGATKPTPQAKKAAAQAPTTTGGRRSRKLLQYLSPSLRTAMSTNDAQSAIRLAVDSANPAATYGATRANAMYTAMAAYPTADSFIYGPYPRSARMRSDFYGW